MSSAPSSSLAEAEAHYRKVMKTTEQQRQKARASRLAAIKRELRTRSYRDVAKELGVHNSYLVRLVSPRR